MPKMIVSIDGVVDQRGAVKQRSPSLGSDVRTTISRRQPRAVSGEHAALQIGNEVYVEDLNSTNGTQVNGSSCEKQRSSIMIRLKRQVQKSKACSRRRPLQSGSGATSDCRHFRHGAFVIVTPAAAI
jgi:pSer/pThr/pTyr-binding forkhead associated (FHA) protein